MWSLTGPQAVSVGAAGLIACGLLLLGIVVRLLRPVLLDDSQVPTSDRTRWFLADRSRAALALTVILAVGAIGAAAVIGDRAHRSQSRGASSQSAAATSTADAAVITVATKAGPSGTLATGTAGGAGFASADPQLGSGGKWEAGDMHSHTFLTGGSSSQSDVAHKAFDEFHLDWIANSEHGGEGEWDQSGNPVAKTPRWWSLVNWSWPIIRDLRTRFPGKTLIQGVEWNVPNGGDASVGIASDHPVAVAEFDYRFDADSKSTSFPGAPSKHNADSADAIDAVAWLQANYSDRSYLVLNHPSRGLAFSAADVRDYIAAGPGVVAGFEGMPGHQKQRDRGSYESANPLGRTYQGADIWLAEVGGLWDSILGNGSRFHVFANSDYHATADDFWPGEYAKSWTFVSKPDDMNSLVAGLKSGRSFSSFGDLVDGLKFSAQGDGEIVGMGSDALNVRRGSDVVVTIKFHSPPENSHGDVPTVDHLDLIAGNVTGPASKGTVSWTASTNPSTRVVRTFPRAELQSLGDGWYAAACTLTDVQGSLYLRLRATNVVPNTPVMTDVAGNPLVDVPSGNGAAKAWKSLWFYSNPLWIDVR
jgi:hypothetical protein